MLKQITVLIFVGLTVLSCNNANENSKEKKNSDTQKITILQTADIHGQVNVHDEFFWENNEMIFKRRGGMASIKTLFDDVKSENQDATIVLDGGDLIQGSAVAALSEGQIFPDIVNKMGYDFLIPGNWEVVYGKSKMLSALKKYEPQVIAANMYDEAGENLLFPPYFIKEVGDTKLGFIAYNDPEIPVRQNPSFSKGIGFKSIESNLSALISELKTEQNVDILFLVTHIGIAKQVHLADQDILKDIDYVLGNDTHERIRKPLQRKFAKVTEPGAFGSFVGRLDLEVKDGKIVNETYDLMEVDPEKYPADPEVQKSIDSALQPYKSKTDQILGYTNTPLYRYFVVENPMDNMITDAARWKMNTDISLSNGFRFSPPLVPKDGKPAAITYSYIWNMLPVNEKVKTGEATGEQIKNWLEQELHNVFADVGTERFGGWLVRFSGMELEFNAKAKKGNRVVNLTVNGEPMDMNKYYSISACRRDGEALDMLCRLPNVKNPKVHDFTIHEVLVEYLNTKDAISPVKDGRAKALDLGEDVLSQLPDTDYHFH